MTLNDYQNQALTTATYPKEQSIIYPTLGLNGEAGEVAEKVKKVYRDNDGYFDYERREAIAHEIGDCLWYCAVLAADLELSLEYVARLNVEKLADRKRRNAIHGNGDYR